MRLRQWRWFSLGVLALLLRELMARYPDKTDQFYSRGLFPIIRTGLDYTLGIFPFPSVFLFVAFILFLIILFFRRLAKRKAPRAKGVYVIQSILNFAGGLVFFFLLLWGFNYQRSPLATQLGLEVKPMDLTELQIELEWNYAQLISLRRQLTSDTLPIETIPTYSILENQVRDVLKEQLPRIGLSYVGRPRTKQFPPAGLMRRLGVLGIYFPFVGESYLDPVLHPLEKPFTIAHEMAHSIGITDEGEANFVAWIVSSRSGDSLIAYTAALRLFLYQIRDFYRLEPDAYRIWIAAIDTGVLNDIRSIQARAAMYPPFFREISRATNDLFLKSQGVRAGVLSYQELPMLVKAWREKQGS